MSNIIGWGADAPQDKVFSVLLKRFQIENGHLETNKKIYNKNSLSDALKNFKLRVDKGEVFGESDPLYGIDSSEYDYYKRYTAINLTNIKFKIDNIEIKEVGEFIEVYGFIKLINIDPGEFKKNEPSFGLRALNVINDDLVDIKKIITFDSISN